MARAVTTTVAGIAVTVALLCILVASAVLVAYSSGLARKSAAATAATQSTIGIEFVVSRYGERLDWLADPLIIASRPRTMITIYNKGPLLREEDLPALPSFVSVRIRPRPNVGRDFETYLHHIVTSMESGTLADVTVFLPDTCATIPGKLEQARDVCARLPAAKWIPESQAQEDLHALFGSFQAAAYQNRGVANRALNADTGLAPATPRPMGAWMREVLRDDMETVGPVIYCGIIAATRDTIARRPLALYHRLLAAVNTHHNPEAGHYMERIWGTLLRCSRDGSTCVA